MYWPSNGNPILTSWVTKSDNGCVHRQWILQEMMLCIMCSPGECFAYLFRLLATMIFCFYKWIHHLIRPIIPLPTCQLGYWCLSCLKPEAPSNKKKALFENKLLKSGGFRKDPNVHWNLHYSASEAQREHYWELNPLTFIVNHWLCLGNCVWWAI